jgi:adenosine deaminase
MQMKSIKDKIAKLPKGDVHNHLHLGGSIINFQKKYSNYNIEFPKTYNGLGGMIDFIYNDLNKAMLTGDDVIFFMENAIESSIDDNIVYLEASVDMNLIRFFDQSLDRLLEVIKDLKYKYHSKIEFCPDLGVNKDLDIDQVYRDGSKCIQSGIFNGIDLYGQEVGKDLDVFVELYQEAKLNNLTTKVHIGEFSNHDSIEYAINILKPDELQHGINAIDSINTMNLILENNIQLNVCPQSNISLGTVKNIAEHPIRKLFDHGIKVTVNTDDLILFDATVSDQLIDLYENDIFSFEEIEKLCRNAIK